MDTRLAVRARGIIKCFGEVVALDGIDLDVARGQIHGLVGPNGAGKTTLLGLLLGLAVADGGDLDILGVPVGRALAAPDGVDTPAPQDPTAAAVPSASVPTAEKPVAAQWNTWKSQQRLTGPSAVPDYANPAQMNHLTWYETHNWKTPYPGESKIFAPNDVPGAYIPSSENDG